MVDEDEDEGPIVVKLPHAAQFAHAAELLRALCDNTRGLRVMPEAASHVGYWLSQDVQGFSVMPEAHPHGGDVVRADSKVAYAARILLMLSAGPLVPAELAALQRDALADMAAWLERLADMGE